MARDDDLLLDLIKLMSKDTRKRLADMVDLLAASIERAHGPGSGSGSGRYHDERYLAKQFRDFAAALTDTFPPFMGGTEQITTEMRQAGARVLVAHDRADADPELLVTHIYRQMSLVKWRKPDGD